MQVATKKYAERAQAAVREGRLFPVPERPCPHTYPKDLWFNDEHDGVIRIYIRELCGPQPCPRFAEGATREMLMWATAAPLIGETRRRIIVVEDMNRRIAELLGVRLEIPPEFFFAHCREELRLNVVNHASAPQFDQYWRVNVPGRRWLPGPISANASGLWNGEAGFYHRGQAKVEGPMDSSEGANIVLNEFVSYWATEYEDGSWTVVLLVDPFERILRSDENPEATMKTIPRLFTSRLATEVLPSATADLMLQSETRSLYDGIVSAHVAVAIQHDRRPFSGTAFVRNLVRAAWEEMLYRTEWHIHDDLIKDGHEHRLYEGNNNSDQNNGETNFNAKKYQTLVKMRMHLQSWRRRLEGTTYAFSMNYYDQQFEPWLPDGARWALVQERRIWARLHDKLASLEAIASSHMEAFSARATLEGDFAAFRQAEDAKKQTEEANNQTAIANRQARSAGQLTKIATIIVPCTFVASIFSMGGSFAAGERHFYVYWAISVPVTLALLLWVLHGDIKETWQKWRGTGPQKVKEADKMV